MHVRRHSCAISDAGTRFPSLASETPIAEAARFTPGRFQLGPIRSLPAELTPHSIERQFQRHCRQDNICAAQAEGAVS
jgi:hypothetical protein